MSTITLIGPQTAAGVELLNTDPYHSVVLHAEGLAGAEEVDIEIMGGAAAIPYTVGGVAVTLTATAPNATLPTGPVYQISKDATAGACVVQASVAAEHGN
jgi:hypothetical protein